MEPRIKRLLDRRGLGDGDNDGSASDAWAEEAPVLAGLAAASVQGTAELLAQAGRPDSAVPPHRASVRGGDPGGGFVETRRSTR